MQSSYRIARIAGIDVRMHVTFPLLLVFWGWQGWQSGGGFYAFIQVLVVTLLFLCVLLHEFGHAFAGRIYGIRTPDITLLPIGGLARLERIPENPVQELVIAVAGPAVNAGIAAGLWLALQMPVWNEDSQASLFVQILARHIMQMNVMLIAFNAIPAFPMDGGRVLRALLAMCMDHVRATQVAARVGQGAAVVLGCIGLFGMEPVARAVPLLSPLSAIFGSGTNPFLVLIAIFVFQGAQREAAFARIRSHVAGMRAADAMITQFQSFPADTSVAQAARQADGSLQTEYPVTDARQRALGIVTSQDLFAPGRAGGATVGSIVRDVPLVRADATFDEVISLMRQSRNAVLPVVDADGRLLGLVSINLLNRRVQEG